MLTKKCKQVGVPNNKGDVGIGAIGLCPTSDQSRNPHSYMPPFYLKQNFTPTNYPLVAARARILLSKSAPDAGVLSCCHSNQTINCQACTAWEYHLLLRYHPPHHHHSVAQDLYCIASG